MDIKTAYCCLNCAGNCCQECAVCSECCKDCGDLSECKSSAFLDKDNNFYLKWQGTYSSQYSESTTYLDDTVCIDHIHLEAINSVSTFDSDGNCNTSYFASSFNSPSCCECDCPGNTSENLTDIGYQVLIIGNENSGVQTTIVGKPTEDPDDLGCENLGEGYSSSTPTVGYPCPGPSEQSETEQSSSNSCDGSGGECQIYQLSSSLEAIVTWISPLNFYDNKGDIVENPWSILPSPTPYDPLNPIRVVNTVGCHYFHP